MWTKTCVNSGFDTELSAETHLHLPACCCLGPQQMCVFCVQMSKKWNKASKSSPFFSRTRIMHNAFQGCAVAGHRAGSEQSAAILVQFEPHPTEGFSSCSPEAPGCALSAPQCHPEWGAIVAVIRKSIMMQVNGSRWGWELFGSPTILRHSVTNQDHHFWQPLFCQGKPFRDTFQSSFLQGKRKVFFGINPTTVLDLNYLRK